MASSGGELGGLFEHHVQRAVCDTRAKYREGRRPRAVRVYTINLESRYLLIQGVPAVGAMKELVERFALYGAIEQYNALDEYPAEDFTEVYLIKFMNLQSARTAKRKMDEQSFFGGLLHVCYAPEFETVEETRKKLQERKAYIARTAKNKALYVMTWKNSPGSTVNWKMQKCREMGITREKGGEVEGRKKRHTGQMNKKAIIYGGGTRHSGSKEREGHFMTKKKLVIEHKDTKDFRQDSHSKKSGFCEAALNTSAGKSDPCLPYSCELPLCNFSSKCICSSGEYVNRASNSSRNGRNHDETVGHCSHNDSWQKMQMKTLKNSVSCPGAITITSSAAVDRFMPRTTQLQERKRRREDDRKLGPFLETSKDSNEVVIGPQLPDIPKVDMHDDSLNTTANLIRSKLKEVVSSVPKPPEDKLEDVHTSHPLKQRRRI
uniref:RNA-binding protein 48 n=1 Tax=Molossus molossus TaxID=27622 RepID=A0A7J8HE66_MOLMO|nr:RNA binding motif protein 48 [Molossus molossus]